MKTKHTLPVLGIDIGTTGIGIVLLDLDSGKTLDTYTVPNDSALISEHPWEKMQNADRILAVVLKRLTSIEQQYPNLSAIGLTGQMHGILYTNANGNAVSPLYTWQDERAGIGTPAVCDTLYQSTGYRLAPGYGLATHSYNLQHGMVPDTAVSFCTVMDYIGIKLCGLRKPVIHSSNAASLGLFHQTAFDESALTAAGINAKMLPQVTSDFKPIGYYHNIPVSVAIGDNQASFIGSVKDPKTQALCNIGTGSQISLRNEFPLLSADPSLESRPLYQNYYLHCGSALCGGRAYALLQNFFASYLEACGMPKQSQYETMNRLAEQALSENDLPTVFTTFCGTRSDPNLRGSILRLSEQNFTPQALIAGTLFGIAEELFTMYQAMPHDSIDTLILSGNGAKNNPVLCQICSKVFSLPILLPENKEEAARGAAMFAAVSAGYAPDLAALSHCITYTKG